MKKVYLAGPCSSEHRTLMKSIADYLRCDSLKCFDGSKANNEQPFDVYCPFELNIKNAWDMSQEEWAKKVFAHDVTAINNCDYFVMISFGRISSAGTNWEQGYAYAIGKPVFVFQVTDAPTSLMTYCGCTSFVNANVKDIDELKEAIYKHLKDEVHSESPCKTLLT